MYKEREREHNFSDFETKVTGRERKGLFKQNYIFCSVMSKKWKERKDKIRNAVTVTL